MERLDEFQVGADATILEALEVIDRAGNGLALVCAPDRKVLGTLTDGDVRRALIKGAQLEERLLPEMMQRDFARVGPDVGRTEVLDLMLALKLRHIVVVDKEECLTGLHLLHELVGHSQRENWAVVMAGGRGVRLRPITEDIPKPMVKVAGRPILERLVLHLVSHGISKIYVSVNHLSHVIEEHFGDGKRLGCSIEYLREKKPLGTGGSLGLLPRPTSPVLVTNGDLITEADIGNLLDFHAKGSFAATVGLRPYSVELPFGVADVKGERLIALREKPIRNALINAGIYVLSPEVVERVRPDEALPITTLVESCLEEGLPVGAHLLEGDWMDVGRHDQLKQARGEL